MKRVGKGFSRRETPLFQTIVVQAQAEMSEGSASPTDPHHTPTIIQPSTSQPQKKQRPRKPKRKDTEIPQSSVPSDNVADEAVNEEIDTSLVRATTTITGLDESRIGVTSIRPNPRQHLMNQVLQELVQELMELCITLQSIVLALETTKTTQANEITKGLGEENASKHGRRIHDIDADEDITLVNDQDDADMFGVNDLDGDEVLTEPEVTVKDVNLGVDEVTLAQALAALKSAKVQEKANVIEKPSEQ
ncbi:hypothetical protein Tco_1559962 [Tanacetum coccineum]